MKKLTLIRLLMALFVPLALVSCSEDDDTVEEFPNWERTNSSYFLDKYNEAIADPSDGIDTIRNFTLEPTLITDYDDYIVVEKLVSGGGSGCPMYSDSVVVAYRGRLLPSTSYPEGYVFDGTYNGEFDFSTAGRATLYVGGMIDGFTTALQQMHIGDYWRVYIPSALGYGSVDSGSIPAYSTLVFDIALYAYYRAGTPVGTVRSAAVGWVTE